ncbi:hypothetical protein VSR01_17305 [Actinacidiphila sp. DG2A-62]|uniref:hypothetical protein n=1 Tax=Actinacidiphila sp. DG2A-62 TaxID=3108821 RepID=UPI002DBD3215|nr:hypothetical protein [Actinacidiphila sp. DG2A-62]MEC3995196.1 hypothetical protein [Actinacidiphila sp. DG2A-62]
MTNTRPLHELAGLIPVRSATTALPHYAETEGAPAVCTRQTGARMTDAEAAAAPRFCSHCVAHAEKLAAERAEPASPLTAAARAFADSIEPGDRNEEIRALARRADVDLAHSKNDFEPHFADPAAVITLCHEPVERRLNEEQAARVPVLCKGCAEAAERIAERREAEEAAAKAPVTDPRAHRFDSTREAYDATQWNDEIRDGDVLVIASEKVVGILNLAWPVALTVRHGELHTLAVPISEVGEGRYAESARLAGEQARELHVAFRDDHAPDAEPTVRQVNDMLQAANEASTRVASDPDPEDPQWRAALARLTAAIEFLRKHCPGYAAAVEAADRRPAHLANVARGCAPRHCGTPDVGAALGVLDGLACATLTDEHDMTDPSDTDLPVRGFAVEPRGHGLVAAYWLERGLARRRDDGWHGPALDALADRFKDAGWAVEPLRPSSLCVFAHRPQPDAAQTPAR